MHPMMIPKEHPLASVRDYVKVCEDGENVIAIGAAMYYINQAAVRL